MLLVGRLHGRNINDIKQSADVVDVVDVVDNVVDVVDGINENHVLNVHDRRKRLLELVSANASISIAELALIMAVTKHTVDRDIVGDGKIKPTVAGEKQPIIAGFI